MTPDAFRQLALSHLNARSTTRLGAVELLIGDKVFATLGSPDPALATLRLSPDDQRRAIAQAASVFSPQPGGAGARGVTQVRLATATPDLLAPFLTLAAHKARNARSVRTQLT